MEAADVKYVFRAIEAAAPRYADTPTPSRIVAVVMKEWGEVMLKA